MVHAHRAEEARALLAEATAEGEQEAPESVNARYLEEGSGGRGPRDYGVIGAYVRAFAVSVVVMAFVSGVWFLFRAL